MTTISGIGLGTFPFSNVFSHVSESDISDIVYTYLENGGRYIETAPLYQINPLLRKILLKIPRHEYYLSSKCVTGIGSNGEKIRSGKYESILAQCDLELKTLGLDHIDLYMIHIPPPDATPEETMSALLHLKEQGKIQEIGVSNVSMAQLKEFLSYGPISYIQNRFSLLNRSLSDEMIRFLIKNKIFNIPYQVIERGLLTNKIISGLQFREGDLRTSKPEFSEDKRTLIASWVSSSLYPIAKELGISIETLALAWALQQPFVAVCSVGATSKTQVLENIRAQTINIHPEAMRRIDSAYQDFANTIVRKQLGIG
jgi:methylglyoxal reductase